MFSSFMSNSIYLASSTKIKYEPKPKPKPKVEVKDMESIISPEIAESDGMPVFDIPTEFGYGGYKTQPGKFLDEALYYKF